MRRLLYLLALPVLYQPAAAETILVSEDSPSGPFGDPLEHAVGAASPGDTIRVAAGWYSVGLHFHIDKPLTLLGAGADSTIVYEGSGLGGPLSIEAEAVTIEGFHLEGCWGRTVGCSAVACHSCSATLRHNTIWGGQSAIRIAGDSRITINYNELHFAYYGIESIYNPHPVDARFNWWAQYNSLGTTDEDEIKKQIYSNKGKIEYRPWLHSPDAVFIFTKTSTLISTSSWGWLKRKGR